MKTNNKGFTLLEILIAVLIIGILVAIALPQYIKAVDKSRLAEVFLLTKRLEGSVKYLANKEIAGEGRQIVDSFGFSGASWDESGLKYSTQMHSLDIACHDAQCVANIYYPKTGTPKYTLTFSGRKDEDVSKTCQGPDYICNFIADKGFTKI